MGLDYDEHIVARNSKKDIPKEEREVLCIKSEYMPSDLHATSKPMSMITSGSNFGLWLANPFDWVKRGVCETDPGWKQVIPYISFVYRKSFGGHSCLMYSRKKGGEGRLDGKLSVGIGGHIERCDEGRVTHETYGNAVRREIEEEITTSFEFKEGIDGPCGGISPPVAFIYDPTNEVGRVHLGLLHVVHVDDERVTSNETCVFNPRFVSIGDLAGKHYENLENWSKVVVDCFCEGQ